MNSELKERLRWRVRWMCSVALLAGVLVMFAAWWWYEHALDFLPPPRQQDAVAAEVPATVDPRLLEAVLPAESLHEAGPLECVAAAEWLYESFLNRAGTQYVFYAGLLGSVHDKESADAVVTRCESVFFDLVAANLLRAKLNRMTQETQLMMRRSFMRHDMCRLEYVAAREALRGTQPPYFGSARLARHLEHGADTASIQVDAAELVADTIRFFQPLNELMDGFAEPAGLESVKPELYASLEQVVSLALRWEKLRFPGLQEAALQGMATGEARELMKNATLNFVYFLKQPQGDAAPEWFREWGFVVGSVLPPFRQAVLEAGQGE